MDAAKYLFIPPAMGKKDAQAAMKGVFTWFMFQLQMFKQPDLLDPTVLFVLTERSEREPGQKPDPEPGRTHTVLQKKAEEPLWRCG